MKKIEQIIKEYGNIELSFSSYYKYSFSYQYSKDNVEIYGSYGGSHDDIYRYDCSPDKKVLVKDFLEELNYLTVKEDGVEVFNYSNY